MEPRRLAVVRAVAWATLVTWVLLGMAPPAAAHADFLSSTPAPYDIWNVVPKYVSVTVSEAVQPGSPSLRVTDMVGVRVDTGPTVLSPSDPRTFSVRLVPVSPSVFTVAWSVVSADDGHFSAGSFYFMLSNRDGTLPGPFPQTGGPLTSPPVSPLDAGLRALDFIGFAIAFGGSLLAALLWAPAASRLEGDEARRGAEGYRTLLGFSTIGAAVYGAATAGLWAEGLALAPPSGLAGIVGSAYLLSLVARLALGAVLAALLYRMFRRTGGNRLPAERPPEFLPSTFCGFMLILLEVASSHSAIAKGWWPVGPIADAAHLYGAALWVGGLLAVLRVRRWLRADAPPAFAREVLEAFSRIAFLGVALVVFAGVLLAVVLVGSLDALVGTGYGWVVLAKGLLLVPMVAVGAWNRARLRRQVDSEADIARAVAMVARNARVEAMLGAAVLVLAGLLVTMNPAAAPGPQNATFTLSATSHGLYALLHFFPYPAGPGTYVVTIEAWNAANGSAWIGATNRSNYLVVSLPGSALAPQTLPLQGPHGPNHFYAENVSLSVAGTWQVDGHLTLQDTSTADFLYQVPIHA